MAGVAAGVVVVAAAGFDVVVVAADFVVETESGFASELDETDCSA